MRLLVFVPGLGSNPEWSACLVDRLRADLGEGWEVRCFWHGIKPWSTERLSDVAHRLAVQVRTWAGDNGVGEPAEEVRLVGHSLGGLLCRNAYLLDRGAMGEKGRPAYPWTAKVRRIVLLAAPNAGFRPERMRPLHRAAFSAAAAFRQFSVEDIQSGSPYVTELRLRWVNAFRDGGGPEVVQVLGDLDSLVAREDSLDVEFMPGATRVDVPGATHQSVVRVTEDPADERYCVLRYAIRDPLGVRAAAEPVKKRPVYFLLHGIRAGRYANWVGSLASELTAADPEAVVYTPSYGYLSAVEFALPFTRSRNLRRFLDWYCRVYVTADPACLHFAGHSNGTYLLGRALESVPALRFGRVYLAGSVLPREYPWTTIEQRGQVGAVHTDRATKDVPVGWLCAALSGLGMRDVGTAGATGFDQSASILHEHSGAFGGGHGAALKTPERISEVAAFLVDGKAGHDPAEAPRGWFGLVGRVAAVAALPALLGGAVGAVVWVLGAANAADRAQRIAALGGGGLVVAGLGRAV